MPTSTYSECDDCHYCDQPSPNQPLIFLGCCFRWDTFETGNTWHNGSNVAALLQFLSLDPYGVVWNHQCSNDFSTVPCVGRTVVTMNICQLKHILATPALANALNLNVS